MSISDPEDKHRNHPEGAVAVGALVVAGGQAAELLAAGDQPLDPVAQPVRRTVEAATPALRPQPGDGVAEAAPPAGGAPRPPGVAPVAHYAPGAPPRPAPAGAADRALLQQLLEGGGLVPLPGRQHQRQRLAAALRAEMDLGGEAALTAPEGLRFWVPPLAPAACWCARTTVPSTKWTPQSSRPAASACRCTAASIPSQTPARRQRRKRVYTLCHGPNRSGRSRHGAPVASFQRMPLMTSRSSLRGLPAWRGGSSGASRAHSVSVNSCRRPIPHLLAHTNRRHNYRRPRVPIEDRP